VTLNGVARAVGICECKPDALSPVWGDTRCRPGIQVCLASLSFHSFKTKIVTNISCTATFFLQVDPHQLLDYENWWKKELNNIRPYVVPPATVDLISKMEVQLEDSSNRIGNKRGNGE